uniref:Uncharacterized protein n=1 Tax=Glossina pallidipes TaxID=7398 RepID=A0A1B0A2D9_GLOPL
MHASAITNKQRILSTNNNNNHNNNNNNNNIVTSATYYHFPQDINTDYALLSQPKTTLTSEETLLLEKALRTHHHNGRSGMGILMHKSNSYSGGIIKPKSTILKQDSINGRISSINPRVYHTATFLGLLPAQMINVYLGSTLRSMHEVLSNHGTAITGYISFGVEVICGVVLMCWVVHKARKELSQTLLTDISNDGKLIDIQV